MMERDGKFHHTQTRSQMAAGYRHSVNHCVANLVSELGKLVAIQYSDVGGRLERIKEGGVAHASSPGVETVGAAFCCNLPLAPAFEAKARMCLPLKQPTGPGELDRSGCHEARPSWTRVSLFDVF
jgi:hypothetical protein